MTTRLEDAVISVRIETGRARSQIESIKGDVGDLDERTSQIGGRAGDARGGTMPSGGGMGGAGGGVKDPGMSSAPAQFGGGSTGTGGGGGSGSPGELQNPLKYLRSVQDLRTMTQAKSPQEMLSAAGGVVETMPGIGFFGTMARGVAAAPDAMVGALETAAAVGIELPWVSALIDSVLPDWLDEQTGGYGSKIKKALLETKGTVWKAKELGEQVKGGKLNAGEWSKTGGNLEDADWEKSHKKIDRLISGVASAHQAFSETRSLGALTSIPAGHAYTQKEFYSHFHRYAEYHDFQYRLQRRQQRALGLEMGMHMWQSVDVSYDTVANLIKAYAQRF